MTFTKLPKAISAEELLSTPLPPVKWIIPDLLPARLTLFAGPSKAGKSWLTLWLCLQVAQGKPMWGREIEPHTVLYLSLEDTFNRLQKRLLQLVGSEEAPERLVMQTECSSIGQGLEEQLTSFIYQHPDTGLIVIDTLQIDRVGIWQGTATELLSAADIEGVLPHQLTRKIVEHFDTVFTPRGIRYETHRTSQARQMKFSHDGNDADDANDAEIDITQLFKWDISQTASSASLASQRSRKESKHGRSVATGQPAEKPTGTAPNPCEAAGA